MRKLLFLLLLIPVFAFGQGTTTQIRHGSTLPSTCSPSNGDVFFKTGTNPGLYDCPTSNTWRLIATASSGSPGGSNTQVQVNDSGSFFGDGCFTYNKSTHVLTLGACGSSRGYIDTLGAAGAPSNPAANTCRYYFDTTSGVVGWVNSSGTSCGPSTSSGTVTSSGSPSSGNIPKFTTSTNIAPAAATDIVALFSTCSGTQYLGADGACHTASSGSGSLVLLEEHAASGSSSLDFTTRNVTGQSGNTFQSDFDDYQIQIVDIIPATNSTDFNLECSSDNGSTWDTTSGHYSTLIAFSASGTLANGSTGTTTKIQLAGINSSRVSNGSGNGMAGSLHLVNPLSTATQKKFAGQITYFDTSASAFVNEIGIMAQYTQTATACTALRFIQSSGNLTSGTIRIYGVAK